MLVSAIFCTSGAQAAVRAKEGFDMVRVPLFFFKKIRETNASGSQINVIIDTGAMSEAIANHFERAIER